MLQPIVLVLLTLSLALDFVQADTSIQFLRFSNSTVYQNKFEIEVRPPAGAQNGTYNVTLPWRGIQQIKLYDTATASNSLVMRVDNGLLNGDPYPFYDLNQLPRDPAEYESRLLAIKCKDLAAGEDHNPQFHTIRFKHPAAPGNIDNSALSNTTLVLVHGSPTFWNTEADSKTVEALGTFLALAREKQAIVVHVCTQCYIPSTIGDSNDTLLKQVWQSNTTQCTPGARNTTLKQHFRTSDGLQLEEWPFWTEARALTDTLRETCESRLETEADDSYLPSVGAQCSDTTETSSFLNSLRLSDDSSAERTPSSSYTDTIASTDFVTGGVKYVYALMRYYNITKLVFAGGDANEQMLWKHEASILKFMHRRDAHPDLQLYVAPQATYSKQLLLRTAKLPWHPISAQVWATHTAIQFNVRPVMYSVSEPTIVCTYAAPGNEYQPSRDPWALKSFGWECA